MPKSNGNKIMKFADNLRVSIVKYDENTSPHLLSDNAYKVPELNVIMKKSEKTKSENAKNFIGSENKTLSLPKNDKVMKSKNTIQKKTSTNSSSSKISKKGASSKKSHKQLIGRKRFKRIIIVEPRFLFESYFKRLEEKRLLALKTQQSSDPVDTSTTTTEIKRPVFLGCETIKWLEPQIKLDKVKFPEQTWC